MTESQIDKNFENYIGAISYGVHIWSLIQFGPGVVQKWLQMDEQTKLRLYAHPSESIMKPIKDLFPLCFQKLDINGPENPGLCGIKMGNYERILAISIFIFTHNEFKSPNSK